MTKILRALSIFFMFSLLSFLVVMFAPDSEDIFSGNFALPSSLLVIEDEAFMGSAFEDVVIPEGTEKIGARAFAGNHLMETVTIPKSVRIIGADAFDGADGVLIISESGSYAESWALAHSVAFVPSDRIISLRAAGTGSDGPQESLGADNSTVQEAAKARAGFRVPEQSRIQRPCEKAKMHPIDLRFP